MAKGTAVVPALPVKPQFKESPKTPLQFEKPYLEPALKDDKTKPEYELATLRSSHEKRIRRCIGTIAILIAWFVLINNLGVYWFCSGDTWVYENYLRFNKLSVHIHYREKDLLAALKINTLYPILNIIMVALLIIIRPRMNIAYYFALFYQFVIIVDASRCICQFSPFLADIHLVLHKYYKTIQTIQVVNLFCSFLFVFGFVSLIINDEKYKISYSRFIDDQKTKAKYRKIALKIIAEEEKKLEENERKEKEAEM